MNEIDRDREDIGVMKYAEQSTDGEGRKHSKFISTVGTTGVYLMAIWSTVIN